MNDAIFITIIFVIAIIITKLIIKTGRITELHQAMSRGDISEVKSWIILYSKYLSKTEKTDVSLWLAKKIT